jgi:hypothetical protein
MLVVPTRSIGQTLGPPDPLDGGFPPTI